MLSYMLPVEEKSPSPRNLNLSLNLNRNGASTQQIIDETSKLLASESTDHRETLNGDHSLIKEDSFDSDASSKKIKMGKLTTTKSVPLKRVSFGSSKGSMVETLVFETPTPLPEHAEREFDFVAASTGDKSTTNPTNGLDDSGIELQEELERSKVRVSFFQCSQPQQVSPPENHIGCFFGDNNNSIVTDFSLLDTGGQDNMTAVAAQPSYDRQNSTESGWDNPFRPGGDLSREADEIVNMIKGGKPITPTGDLNQSIANGLAHGVENGANVVDGMTKSEISQLNASQNGTKSPQKKDKPSTNGDATNVTQTQVVPGPQSASHVVIEDKKKKKCTCCVIQ